MAPKRILLIEDEEEFGDLIAAYLKKKSFSVDQAATGKAGWQRLKAGDYSLVILDLGLPDEDGLEICKKIRERQAIPILILTARDQLEDKVYSLNVGADDYLVKPVALKELVMRIERLLRRGLKGAFHSSIFSFEGIKFNTVTGQLTLRGNSVRLTKKEKAVLEYLVLKQGQVLTRMEIMDHVWGSEINVFSNTVNMVISSLRRKIRRLSPRKFIHSVHGLGYKFETKRR